MPLRALRGNRHEYCGEELADYCLLLMYASVYARVYMCVCTCVCMLTHGRLCAFARAAKVSGEHYLGLCPQLAAAGAGLGVEHEALLPIALHRVLPSKDLLCDHKEGLSSSSVAHVSSSGSPSSNAAGSSAAAASAGSSTKTTAATAGHKTPTTSNHSAQATPSGNTCRKATGGTGAPVSAGSSTNTAAAAAGTGLPQGQPISQPSGSGSRTRPGTSSIDIASGASGGSGHAPGSIQQPIKEGGAIHHLHFTQHSRHHTGPEWKQVLARMRLGRTVASDLAALRELGAAWQ